jgi:glycolate oxidase iron-sulfur subunit
MTAETSRSAIDRIRPDLQRCVGCGNCLHVCPVYRQTGDETYVARGRNQLLKQYLDDPAELNRDVPDRFDRCLLCGRCTAVCPQQVPNDQVTIAARQARLAAFGLSLPKTLAFRHLLTDRARMGAALRLAGRLQRLLPASAAGSPNGLKHIPSEPTGLIRHLPLFLGGLGGGRALPPLAGRALSALAPEISRPGGGRKPLLRVAYFAGCATEFCMPQVGRALIDLVTELGAELVLPRQQGCCGLAVYANGDLETARALAHHNLDVLRRTGADLVVTGCATCGSALKDGWSRLAVDEAEDERFRDLAGRVRDISELLVELGGYVRLPFTSRLPAGTRVTYHDPCHLARFQQVTAPPRTILRQVFGDAFTEMTPNGCCGCGGSFSIADYRLSQDIARQKIDAIEGSGADAVVNTCPGCMLQLIDNIARRRLPQRVVHLVEAVEPARD